MSEAPKRNNSGQPYGVALEDVGQEYFELIMNYYDGRMRRFALSANRLKVNFNLDVEKGRKNFSKSDLALISQLNEMDISLKSKDNHLKWIQSVFNAQKDMQDDAINPITRELVDEFDYALSHEQGGFLNDKDYAMFRQELIGKLATIYGEPINFLGAILRTIVLSVSTVKI